MIQADYEAQFFHKMTEQEHLEAESDCIEDEPVLEQELTEFAEAIYNFTKIGAMDISNIKETTRSFLLANHLVQKDPDQSLPKEAKFYR